MAFCRTLACLAALLAFACALPARAAEAPVIDRVVATIGTEVLTLSKLEFEVRVSLVSQGGRTAATAALPHEVLASGLANAIAQRLAEDEAKKLNVFDVDAQEMDEELNRFVGLLAPLPLERFLQLNGVSTSELEHLLRRDIQVKKYLTSRAQLNASLREADVDAFLAQHAAEVGPHPSAMVREQVRNQLAKQRNEALVRAELRRLYARAKVRIVDPGFAGADASLRSEVTGT